MKIKFSKAAALVCAAVFMAASLHAADNKKNKEETDVEQEYYSDVEPTVVYALAMSEDLANKEEALKFLESAASSGNNDEQIVAALDQLAGEGITSQARKRGRLVNNYPQIRRQACAILAKVGGEHSKNTLKEIAIADNEPSVQAAAIKALGDVGINNDGEVVSAIAFANHRNRVLNPTSSMAAEVLDAFEKLAGSTEDKKAMIDEITAIASNPQYNKAVRGRARELLRNMRSGGSSSSKEEPSQADAK